METLRQPIIKMEKEYVLVSDSVPDSAYLTTSWDWKNNSENYSLSETPSPQSLSPSASYESPLSGCSRPSSLEDLPYGDDMVAYRLLQYPDDECPLDMKNGKIGGHGRRGQHGLKASMSVQRRRKASEREKMRMRGIAEALHTLRRNLPPVYSQGRQPLTKIQTLKCTISYIEELTNLLNSTKGK
ncbi:PREDICTED: mesogenin-1 [Nanorana parkeri]|uniref:mesogenin-1 n=1 Tax=Nanorana parkeri TaxID=125878 RepID=UPI000853FC82|nr:PREDICTED: mesogenin-1 [Nanorana parkeri]